MLFKRRISRLGLVGDCGCCKFCVFFSARVKLFLVIFVLRGARVKISWIFELVLYSS
jgi:hypothetical protein